MNAAVRIIATTKSGQLINETVEIVTDSTARAICIALDRLPEDIKTLAIVSKPAREAGDMLAEVTS